jgi:hypothetical protein
MDLKNYIEEAISSRNNSKKNFELKRSDKVGDWIQKLRDYGLKVEAKSEFSPNPEVGTLSVVDCGDDIIIIFIAGGHGFKEFFNNRGELKSSFYTKNANIVNNMIQTPKWLYIDDDKSIDMVNTLLNGGEINEAISSRKNSSFDDLTSRSNIRDYINALRMYGLEVKPETNFWIHPEEGIVYVVNFNDGTNSLRFIAGDYAYKLGFTEDGKLNTAYRCEANYNYRGAPRWKNAEFGKTIATLNKVLRGEDINEAISSRRNSRYQTVNIDMDRIAFAKALDGADIKEFMTTDTHGIDNFIMKRASKKNESIYVIDSCMNQICVALPRQSEVWHFGFAQVGNLFAPDRHEGVVYIDVYSWDWNTELFKHRDNSDVVRERNPRLMDELVKEFNNSIN